MAKRKKQSGFLITPPVVNRNTWNNPLIDIIETALKGIRLNCENMIAYRYLLNQSIRQYIIPDDNWHLSQAAESLWNSITSHNIREYNYRQQIICNRANHTTAKKYQGNSSQGATIKIGKNDSIPFNQLFTAEHMTPVADVIKALEELNNPSRQDIQDVLDQIHICRVTKEEDKQIQPKYGRGMNLHDILSRSYKDILLKY
jgi:hypothetical protein